MLANFQKLPGVSKQVNNKFAWPKSAYSCIVFSLFETLLMALLDLDNFHEFSRILNDGFKNFHSKRNTYCKLYSRSA